MKLRMGLRLLLVAAFATAGLTSVHAVDQCGVYTSVGNPFACYRGGNCVWWTWREATNAGWAAPLPLKNANEWDDEARKYPKLFVVTSSPRRDVRSIAVDNSAPIQGTTTDVGHVVWITSVSDSTLHGTEMQWGKSGVESKTYAASTFQSFISSTDGRTAAQIGCSDGKVAKTTTDALGNRLTMMASAECRSRWVIATGTTSQIAVSAQVSRSRGNIRFTRSGFGVVGTPMLQSPYPLSVCARASFNGGTPLSLCA